MPKHVCGPLQPAKLGTPVHARRRSDKTAASPALAASPGVQAGSTIHNYSAVQLFTAATMPREENGELCAKAKQCEWGVFGLMRTSEASRGRAQ